MNYITAELDRVIKYAESLGIKVTFKKYKRGDPDATWLTDGSEIELYEKAHKSKTMLILDFIHELAHHMAWVHSGRKGNLKTNYILGKVKHTKRERKIIYFMERDDARYQDMIFKELNIRISKRKFLIEKELSVWVYYRYYQTGKFPNRDETRAKRKELKARYKD